MQYISNTKEIVFSELKQNNYILSPSNCNRLCIKNKNTIKVKDLLDRELKPYDKGCEVGSQSYISKSPFYFIRTKALQPESFLLNQSSDSILPILPSSFKDYDLREGDILISKDSNIGETVILDKNYKNYMISAGIYKLPTTKWKYYLLGFLKTQFFKNQLYLKSSKGAIIKHAKTLFLDCEIPLPNKNKETVIFHIEKLVKAMIGAEKEIQLKRILIADIIKRELVENQKQKKVFRYEYPSLSEVQNKDRIDTGIYGRRFKEIEFIIKNYSNGFFCIVNNNIKSGNTPVKRIIGNYGIYKYRWLTPSHFSEFGTINLDESINCGQANLKENAMLLINRTSKGGKGEYVGIAIFYDYKKYGAAHHNQGIYRVTGFSDTLLKFMTCIMNFPLMREYCGNLSAGAKMKEIKSNQFLSIPFPEFSSDKINLIAKLYHNDSLKVKKGLINEESGIIQLDEYLKLVKERLSKLINMIIQGQNIDLKKINFE